MNRSFLVLYLNFFIPVRTCCTNRKYISRLRDQDFLNFHFRAKLNIEEELNFNEGHILLS